MLNKLNEAFHNHFEDRLFPCNIARDENKKKQVQLPKGWTDNTKEFEEFDDSNSNSIAVRTGSGLVVVDIDTKDLSLLENYMKELVQKWIADKATFTVETTNGYHFYFDSDNTPYSNAVRVSDFIDIRGDGGCVFCYTEDAKSNYKVLCEIEPLPLTEELVEYISIQKRDAKVVEYNYTNNKRIATQAHQYNELMAKGFELNEVNMILKSTGFESSDFVNTEGLYNKLLKLTFILAMNPACRNDQVREFINYIVTEYCGFDIDSDESQKRLYQIFSTMIYCEESKKDILEILEECSIDIDSKLELLHKDLPFLKNGFNLLIGESKSGKTFTTIKSLVDSGFKEKIIHVDFDRNSDSQLENLGVKTYHVSNSRELFKKLSQYHEYKIMDDQIFVIDSLQDLGLENGIDTNSAALETMNRVAIFGDTKATLIVIHHVTLEKGVVGKLPKIKGNSSTISSKCDVSIMFKRVGDKRTMSIMFSRAEDILATGTEYLYNGTKKVLGITNALKK